MSEKRNRWVLNIVLILATVGLISASMVPLISEAFNASKNASPTKAQPSPSQAATASNAEKAKLENEAKGYEAVLQKEPENVVALKGLTDARRQLGDFKGMIEPLEKLAKLNPSVTDYSVLLAQVKQFTNDREGAAQAYREVLRSKPGDMASLSGLADLLVKEKRPEAAIGLLQDTIKQAPAANKTQAGSVDVTAVQVLLGKVFASEKRFDDALNIFNEASRANPKDFQPVLYKAQVLKEQGRTEDAKPLFEQAASLAPAQFKDQIKQLASAAPSPSASPEAAKDGAAPAETKSDAPKPADAPKPEAAPAVPKN